MHDAPRPRRRTAGRAAGTGEPNAALAEPVAVVGISGRFPMAADLDAYWMNLVEGKDCIQEIPPSRWDWRACYGDPAREANRTNVTWGGFIDGVDEFDPLFFGIPPAEAEVMDPQQRLLMLYVWQALEDAAYAPGDLAGSRTGVFVGTGHTGYGTLIDRAGVAIRGYSSTGAVPSIGPNRISYFLNLRGPSEPIETACSSSLVALHRAIAALRTGECGMAIAGGVNTIVTPDSHIGFSKAGMLSPTGQCRAFSDGADGYVRGEGVGMLVLKPLSRAEADGDHIYGVLRGSAVGHNGRTSSLTAPSARAQAELVELAWLQAGVDPRTVTYIEAHGTGTPLGDPIEIDGLKAAFSTLAARTGARDAIGGRCGLGSVKTNIGHLELAAGVAGVIKVLLQLKHGTLVASRHSDRLNPYIDLDGTPFFLVRETQPWKVLVDDRGIALPRRAGVSSFGFGGVNAHIVIEEHVGSASLRASNSAPSGEQGREAHAIVLSARNEARLRERAEQLLNALERGDRGSSDLASVAYTLQVGRDAMEERLGFVVDTLDELRDSLRAYVSGRETTGHLHRGQVKRHKEMVSVIAADEAFQSTVRSWIDERKLATLLALWTKGLNVPWKALHGSPPPFRISLPGYPFARDKYWVPAPQSPAPRWLISSPVPVRTVMPEVSPALMYRPRLRERSIGDPEPAIALDDHVVLLCGVRGVSAQLVESEITGARCRLVPVEDAGAAQVFTDVSTAVFEAIRGLAAAAGRRVLIQVVASADPAHGCLRGLGGLARSARLDHHHLVVQSIEIGGAATPGDVLDVVRQAGKETSTPQFIWSGGRWLQRDWEEIARDGAAAPPWKAGGVYLVTGGAGRIGRCLARDIVATGVDATIVLVGRSAIHEDWTVALNVPTGSRARVEYRAVDVTQRGECAALVRSILQRHGRLNGIVHAAGAVRDRLLKDKSTAEWREVLAPKVAGLVNLDEAASDVPLDFFVAFSSLSGAVGNRGQSDYSTANAFVDAYMAHRRALAAGGARRGTSLSILWPLWRDGGMRVDQETEARMWSGAGLVPLETAAGLEAFYDGVASDAGCLLVASGARERLSTFLRGTPLPPAAVVTPAVATPAATTPVDPPVIAPPAIALPNVASPVATPAQAPPSDETLIAALRQELRAAISSLLKVDASAVDGDDEWNEYGFDSITLTELTNRLNQAYGLDLVPVVLFEHPTLNALARHLVHTCRDRVIRQPEASSRTPPAPMRPVATARQGETPTAPVPVAVIGISGRFPMAPDLDAFWDNLVNGRDCISEVPSSRWDWREWYGDPRTEPNKTRIKWGGFIDGIDEFDPLFFGISPAEAEAMDPQQRLLMTHVWQAIEDAGYAPQSLSGTRTGIFVGTGNTGYGALVERAQVGVQGYSSTGAVPSIGPNRVSYLLNLRGPSEPIETACSSSLVALHHAMQAFENGTCDAAIAGGVNTIPVPGGHIGFEKAGMLSGDGTCRPFSDRANGYVRGEGVGMLFLKRLADAEAANDHIYGVIRASAENHGGRASSLTAPNPAAQAELIVGAYTRAGIDPRTVGYIEAHGTGTTLGDPVEIRGLARAFAELYAATGGGDIRAKHCALGSVKSNVGHLELAAGVAGVLKVLLQLKHRTLVRTLHCEALNPYLQLDGTPFTIVRELQDWAPIVDRDGRPLPRRAGVSSFGFGGVNAHVLIEEYVAASAGSTAARAEGPPPAVAIVLSARTPDCLQEQAARLLAAIRSGRVGQDDLVGVAYTLQVGRDAMDERLALVVNALDALEAKLRAFLGGQRDIVDLFRGQVRRGADGVREQRPRSDSADDAWRAGDPRPLVALWIEGAQADWDRLYTGPRPRRRSLPTYPFARNRYWVTPRGAATPDAARDTIVERPGQSSNPRGADGGERIAESRERTADRGSGIAESGERRADRGSRIAEPGERTADRGSRIAGIRDVVRGSVATALGIEERDIQDDRSFAEYGVDSIVAAGVIDAINDRCGSALNTIVLFDYNTVGTLSEHIAASHPEVVARLHEQGRRDDDERGVTGQRDPIASLGHGAREAAAASVPRHAVAPRAPVDSPGEPIAVLGFSGRYAGSATLDELWHHLVEGHDLVGDVTRWDLARHYAQALGSADRGCLQGSFIGGIDRFDADFFRISALEARYMDP
ncbi:MAG: SDR family NAD(P)-dependent oxidoreductase, partial [Vicinamibacterales bacterium]